MKVKESQISLALLATGVGLLSAGVITLFRLAYEMPLERWLPNGSHEGFESLPSEARVILLLSSTALLIFIFSRLQPHQSKIGVGHVLQRIEQHQGYLPKANIAAQFFGAIIALIGGHSVGREGPAVHIGAGTASQFGQLLKTPHHRLRILAACGVASAISASFNTPMAGVIFAMEVVLLEYSIKGFIPIILASVIGAIVTRAVFGNETAFIVPSLEMGSLLEIPYILLLALICGGVGSLFITSVKFMQRWNTRPIWQTWGLLGICTAIVSLYLPEVMGVGYDSVNSWLDGDVVFALAISLLFAKLFLSGLAAATSFPGGLIGPSLFMGAAIGVLMGQLSSVLMPDYPINIGFYAMLGMGAMMASVLRAPLAALMALLELTANPNIILPGMMAIVIASLTVSEIFHLPSIFRIQTNINVNNNPVQQLLRNTWVGQVMSQSFASSSRLINLESAQLILSQQPAWIFIEAEQQLLLSTDLARFLEIQAEKLDKEDADVSDPDHFQIDCLLLPGDRKMVKSISLMADLQNALDLMQQHHIEWLVVHRDEQFNKVVGIISRDMIEQYYRYQPKLNPVNTA
ncbi:MAG TPA: chloride channel protein [Oceanospirillales bacterium]|jgi:H+/Cl- antiporter ClcA|nr:chloride channel protein [Oceanospirillales bacterium]|tara:strand:- start:588 stop:2315 length:1728 start_codon:yes stop_codon:yes gene_type:complete